MVPHNLTEDWYPLAAHLFPLPVIRLCHPPETEVLLLFLPPERDQDSLPHETGIAHLVFLTTQWRMDWILPIAMIG
jgi:hypothetical protein